MRHPNTVSSSTTVNPATAWRGASLAFVDLDDELLHQAVDHEVAVGDLVLAVTPSDLDLFVPLLVVRDDRSILADLLDDVALVADEVRHHRCARGDAEHEPERTAERVAKPDAQGEQEAGADRDLLRAGPVDHRIFRKREARLAR